VLVPALLLVCVSGAALGLALLHPAKPGTPSAAPGEAVELGDPVRGGDVYILECASCHGLSGEGHIGPPLDGNPISLAEAQAVIESGAGTMPGGLVSGAQERDLLAYLQTILAEQPEG
jgi:mono/diheme cytochrome c family protein